MTKEEQLKQEAEEKYNERLKQNGIKVEYRNETYIDGYLDGAEPREKRIAELELKIKHITQHLEPQTMTALFKQVEEEVKQEQRLNELEKENAELKTKVTALENANRAMVKELADMTSGGVSFLKNVVRSKEEIDKAKKIIKELLNSCFGYNSKTVNYEVRDKAEQFLNSEVEK